MARWLELLSEFKNVLEHRAGQKHGNTDRLSRKTCEDCQQCRHIEKRDGGPTRQELELEPEPPPQLDNDYTPPGESWSREGHDSRTECIHASKTDIDMIETATMTSDHSDNTLVQEGTEFDTSPSQEPPLTTNAILSQTNHNTESLGQAQADSSGAVGLIYKMLKTNIKLTAEQLHLGTPEIKVLNDRKESLRLSEHRVL